MDRFSEIFNKLNEWGIKTFGNSNDPRGCIAHLKKEVRELETNPTDIMEYADAMILLVQGAYRTGYSPSELLDAVEAKHDINLKRKWGEPDENGVVEHIEEVSLGDFEQEFGEELLAVKADYSGFRADSF